MYKIEITEKYGKKEVNILNITDNSTGYDYGNAVAEAIKPYVENRAAAEVEVYRDGYIIHRLYIVPKGGSIMVTEKGADELPLRHQFQVNAQKLPEKYLVMVNPEKNNNKFYWMQDLGNRTWGAFYGRIGEKQAESVYSQHVSTPYIYPDYMYAIKLQEKLLKGYKDKTECHISGDKKDSPAPEFTEIKDKAVAQLIDKLMRFAKKTIEKNYTVNAESVTPVMIKEATAELNKLRKLKTVSAFNAHLLELMHIIPRRIDGSKSSGVASMMAKGKDDFPKIILREESLLDIMKGQVTIVERRKEKKLTNANILDAMGIEVYVARPEQYEKVKGRLNPELQNKLMQVYRVINKKTQARFDQYLREMEKENGRRVKVKEFWHGSRNANWISILQNGLVLNPDAIVTGKMFGNGIYFSPTSMKSWGYTSSRDARWNNEHSDTAYMAMFATAYGRPYEVHSYAGSWSGYDYRRLQKEHPGCSCVHAKADQGMLKNDEVIFYREDQLTINFICEFKAA